MAGWQEAKQTGIAPHYYLVQKEFARLRKKLEVTKTSPVTPPIGRETVDPRAALALWQKSLRRSSGKLLLFFHSFSSTILARSRQIGYSQVLHALVPLEQEVNQLVSLHNHLWQQTLSWKWNEGRILLWRCIHKISADLENIFTFFMSTLEACEGGEKQGEYVYVWNNEISCMSEMSAYKKWQKTMARSSFLSRKKRSLPEFVHAFVRRLGEQYELLCKA